MSSSINNNKDGILLINPINYSLKFVNDIIANRGKGQVDFRDSLNVFYSPPLGLLYLAGIAKQEGFCPRIVDFQKIFCEKLWSGTFSSQTIVGFFEEELRHEISQNQPFLVGISSLFGFSSNITHIIAKVVTSINSEIVVVVGGGYPSNQVKEALSDLNIDYAVMGEGENAFKVMLQNEKEVRNRKAFMDYPSLVTRESLLNGITPMPEFIKELDPLPFPSWDSLNLPLEYIENDSRSWETSSSKRKTLYLVTSRGCPFLCTFCASHLVHGRKVRFHSVDRILEEIDVAVKKYDVNNIIIEDDIFTLKKDRTITFCKELIRRYPGRFNVEFPNGVSTKTLDEEVVAWLVEAGMSSIYIAIESGSEYVQNNIIKKRLKMKGVKNIVEILKKYDVAIRTFFIIGFPGETKAMIQETIDFAENLSADWNSFFIFSPLVGSELYDIAKEKGYLSNMTGSMHVSRGNISTEEFTPEEIEEIHYHANIRINFLNNVNLRNKRFDRAEKNFLKITEQYPLHFIGIYCYWLSLVGQKKQNEANIIEHRLKELSQFPANIAYLEKYQLTEKEPFNRF